LSAATGNVDGNALRVIGGIEWRGCAHLVEGLSGEVGSHDVLAGRLFLPYLEDERAARRRIVSPAINNPIEVKQPGNVFEIGVVPDEKQGPVGGMADGACDGLLANSLLDRPVDMVEKIGGLSPGNLGRALRVVRGCAVQPTCASLIPSVYSSRRFSDRVEAVLMGPFRSTRWSPVPTESVAGISKSEVRVCCPGVVSPQFARILSRDAICD
jgi:hypothetical protein